jgi:tRNA G46 methylase TrmB
MVTDSRTQAAKYYDLSPDTPADVPFYKKLISSRETRVLELGCGTGRVLVPVGALHL